MDTAIIYQRPLPYLSVSLGKQQIMQLFACNYFKY